MKPIHIFKAGTHTSAGGTTLNFGEEVLSAAAAAYDPSIHEAPIVVGHPKDNGPAFGWIKGVSFSDGNLFADPHQINDDFSEQVKAGAYKKVSASFYAPEASANPVPGTYYLRHVGFLGAQPPSIKGLGAVEFSEIEDGDVVEFSGEWETAGIIRRLREFLIDKFSREEADNVIPAYMVESLEDNLRAPTDEPLESFKEKGEGQNMLTEEQLIAAQDKLKAEQDALDAEKTSFTEQKTALEKEKANARKVTIHDQVDKLVDAGKVLPAFSEGLKNFAVGITSEQVVEFGEGDNAQSKGADDFLFSLLSDGVKAVDFGERTKDEGKDLENLNSEGLAEKAIEYRESEAKAGRQISFTAAVNHIQAQGE